MERIVSICVTRGERTQWKKVEDRPGDSDGFLGEARHQFRQGTAFQIRMSDTAAAATLMAFASISPLFRDPIGHHSDSRIAQHE